MSSKSKSLSGSKTINNKIKLKEYTYRTVQSSGTKSSYDVDGNEADLFSCLFSVKNLWSTLKKHKKMSNNYTNLKIIHNNIEVISLLTRDILSF